MLYDVCVWVANVSGVNSLLAAAAAAVFLKRVHARTFVEQLISGKPIE